MKTLLGGRSSGKTSRLIQRAHEENLYILCPTRHMAHAVARQATEMGLDIPYPLSREDLPLSPNGKIDKVLVDEGQMLLQKIIGKPIELVTFSTPFEFIGIDFALSPDEWLQANPSIQKKGRSSEHI